ncbi:unnamed protein product [Brassica rapa subsp. narinosa]
MKVAFKPWFIGFVMLAILLFGERAIARTGENRWCFTTLTPIPSSKNPNPPRCTPDSCKALCLKKKKALISKCLRINYGCMCRIDCAN